MQLFGAESGCGVIANVGTGGWGGGVCLSPALEGRGGSAAADGLDEAALARLDAMEAKAAVDSVAPANAADKLPSVDEVTFPGPVSEAFYWDDSSVVGIQGPVGSGKTTTLLKSRIRRAIMMPQSVIDGVRRYKLLVCRQTYRELWATTIPSYLETFPKEMGVWSGGRGDPVTHVIHFEDEFGRIEFTTEFMAFGDDIAASMRGIQTTDIWPNEADTVPVDILTVGIGRINRWPGRQHFAGLPPALQSYGQIVCDFNAPDEDNWTFGVFHNEKERNRLSELMSRQLPEGARRIAIEFYRQPGFGEPRCENLQNLAPGYYETQIAVNTLAGRGDVNDRLVYNKTTYLRVGDPVFKREWNRRVHVSDGALVPIPELSLMIGLDQGFKGAAVIGQFVPPYGWRIYAELHFPDERLMAQPFGLRLAMLLEDDPRFKGLRIEGGWADMAGEHGASQAADENDTWNRLVGQAANITIRPQRIGTNRINPRLEAVRAALEYLEGGRPGLLIDPGCKFLIRGFEARYVWTDQVNPSGDKRKVPDKSFTEANVHDALQYLALSQHRADGTSPISFAGRSPLMGHNGRSSMPGATPGGLTTGYDVLNPYGG